MHIIYKFFLYTILMREFILRTLKGRTTEFDINKLPAEGRMDLVCRCISNALFISNDLRRDTIIHVVLDGPSDPPKVVSFYGDSLKGMEFDEKNIAEHINEALIKGKNLKLNEEKNLGNGIKISKKSFEQLVKEKFNEGRQLFYLHDSGNDIRETKFKKDVVFVFGDFIGMPRKTEGLLDRYKAERISLGPRMLFASHCIVVVNNELDRG
jgi:tRNA (pseudouridine54-N1)-methyltransferase